MLKNFQLDQQEVEVKLITMKMLFSMRYLLRARKDLKLEKDSAKSNLKVFNQNI
jgi:hypothetical protein